MNYYLVAHSWLDLICKTDLWYRKDLWGTDERVISKIARGVKLSSVVSEIFGVSKSEFRRKLKEGAVDFGKNGKLAVIRDDVFIQTEGYYEVKYGKYRALAVVVCEPWYSALQMKADNLWSRFSEAE